MTNESFSSNLNLEQKSNFLVLRFKKVYIHFPCTVHGGEASILSPGIMSAKEKSL